MPSFGFGEVPAGSDVTHLVRTLDAVRKNPAALQAIEEATTSCVQWGEVLQQLMPDAKPIFFRKPGVNIRPADFNTIAQELGEGNAVLVSMKFPGSTNHVFAIEARENGTARILHAWQGKHQLRVERTMPVKEMLGYLKRLPELDWVKNKPELQNIRHQLWGADHAEVPDIGTSAKRRISYEMLIKGKPFFFENRIEHSVLYVLYRGRIFFVNASSGDQFCYLFIMLRRTDFILSAVVSIEKIRLVAIFLSDTTLSIWV